MCKRLTIDLKGICVHFDPGMNVPGVARRVAYPAGVSPFPEITVENHSPTYQIENETPVALSEATVTFSTTDAVTTEFRGAAGCAPHIRRFFDWFELDPDKVFDRALTGGAYIDLTIGELCGTNVDGAADTHVHIEYEDTVTEVQMTISPWSGGSTQFNIPLPGKVTFNSMAIEHHVDDYYVTFNVAELDAAPAFPIVKEEVDKLIEFVNVCLLGEGDAGCSNSQFP